MTRPEGPGPVADTFPFRAVFEASFDAIGVSLEGVHLVVNPAYVSLFGYDDASQIVGRPILDLIAPEARATILDLVRRRTQGESVPGSYLTRGLRRDGTPFDMEVHVTGFEKDGRIHTLAILRDVTASRRAEEILRASEERWRRTLEALPVAVVVHSGGGVRWANVAMARLLGFVDPEELVGRRVLDFVHPDDRSVVVGRIERLRRGETVELVEERFVRKDGAILVTEVVATPFSEGQPGLVLVAARDVTEARQALRSLEEKERTLRESQAVARLGSYVLDVATGHWSSSPMLDEVLGIDRTWPHTEEGWVAVVHPDDRLQMIDYFLNHVIRGRNFFSRDYRILRPSDGAVRWVMGLGELDFGPDGATVRMRGTIQDITERKLAEEALREGERELATWHDLVTHDLANFSMTLLGLVERMVEGDDGPLVPAQEETLRRVYRQAFELQRLADNAKLLARLRAGVLEISGVGSADLAAAVAEAIASVKAVHFDREVEILTEGLDGMRSRQIPFLVNVFLNLIDNAIRHGGRRAGTIRVIGSRESPGTLEVRVEGGAPPPAELLPRIFDRYVRGPRSSGTGLGLATVRELVVAAGGTVEARVAGEPGEERFEVRLRLPAADETRS